MALTLVATAGASNANSYATATEGDTFHETRLHVSDWTSASTTNKEAALVWATRLLDENIDFYGIQRWNDQSLRWPRSGLVTLDGDNIDDETIPQFLINASSEFARLLIASDRTADRGTIGFESITVGPISLDVDKFDGIKVIPDSVWAMVSHVGVRINEVSSGFSSVDLVRV